MLYRHWLGDLALAVLLAVPPVALSQPQPLDRHAFVAPAANDSAPARVPGNGRISLLG
jgi:hypothetical protein